MKHKRKYRRYTCRIQHREVNIVLVQKFIQCRWRESGRERKSKKKYIEALHVRPVRGQKLSKCKKKKISAWCTRERDRATKKEMQEKLINMQKNHFTESNTERDNLTAMVKTAIIWYKKYLKGTFFFKISMQWLVGKQLCCLHACQWNPKERGLKYGRGEKKVYRILKSTHM